MSDQNKRSRWRIPIFCALAAALALTLILGHSIYRERTFARKLGSIKTGDSKDRVRILLGPANVVFPGPPLDPALESHLLTRPPAEIWIYGRVPQSKLAKIFFPAKLKTIEFDTNGKVISVGEAFE